MKELRLALAKVCVLVEYFLGLITMLLADEDCVQLMCHLTCLSDGTPHS